METSGTLAIEARPAAFELDPERAAVIVVDMQNDFSSERGLFGLAGVPLAPIHAVVEPIARVLTAARLSGIPIVYIKTGFETETSDVPAALRDHPAQKGTSASIGTAVEAPDGSTSRVMIRGTWNTDVVDELRPAAEDRIVWKTRYSAFFRTDLDDVLTELDVRDLVFTGCTTSVCVDSSVKDAMFRDYNCLVLEDCVAEPIDSDLEHTPHEATLRVIETVLGFVGSSAPLIEELAASAAGAADSREPSASP